MAVKVSLAVAAAVVVAGCTGEPPLAPWDDPGTSEQLLGFDVMPELELLVEPDAVAALEREPRVYVPATIVHDGERYGPVGLRLKGGNSFLPFHEKPAFRVNINEYIPDATFFGLKDMTLNNMSSDWSMMHERLAYWFARSAGVPASRANHALVTVNGDFYGLYQNVETVKSRMLKAWFDDNDGSLFEATDVDFAPAYVDAYEVQDGPGDRTLIAGAAAALVNPDAEAAIAAVAEFIDLEAFLTFWAFETVVGQYDAFPYSVPGDDYFVYADPTTSRLAFLPWGMDETFFSADFSPLQTSSVLAARCKEVPSCFQGYVDRTWELVALAEDLGLEAQRARVEEQIAPYAEADTRKPYSMTEVAEGQLQLGYFIRGRREILEGMLPPPSRGL